MGDDTSDRTFSIRYIDIIQFSLNNRILKAGSKLMPFRILSFRFLDIC
jgi:hypothetical protein